MPGRNHRPGLGPASPPSAAPLAPGEEEDLCDFCPARYRNTPPEKARLVLRHGRYVEELRLPAAKVFEEAAEFRRISNLFEISTFSYWTVRYGYTPPRDLLEWRDAYLADPEGYAHLKHVLGLKRAAAGRDGSAAGDSIFGSEEVRRLSTPFFAGTHELVVARRHVRRGARSRDELCGPGDLTPSDHARFLRFTAEASRSIRRVNPRVRHVYVFQNWRKAAGASFDHLHKQLVGADRVGPALRRLVRCASGGKHPFRTFLEAAIREGLVVACNDHAVAVADPGRPHPAVRILSLGRAGAPLALDTREQEGLSDLVHGCHAAWTRLVPSNEIWFHDPKEENGRPRLPIQVVIQWRMNLPAGFEAGAGIHVNPMTPHAVRDTLVERMLKLRDTHRIASFSIGKECGLGAGVMAY